MYVFRQNGPELELISADWEGPFALPSVISGFLGTIVVQALAGMGTGGYSVEVTRQANL